MPFNRKLVLNQYLLSLFRVENFNTLASYANRPENDGLDENNVSRFHTAILNALGSHAELDKNTLLRYDHNIVAHTRTIRGKRPDMVRWKYFQYLALLFTEVYLDRYMNRRDDLLTALNCYLDRFNRLLPIREHLPAFSEDDLRRLAFWSATGSGKTLIMHVNIKQFLYYLDKSRRTRDFNRILLVTPNEGLSRQHLDEMHLSGIYAEIFTKIGSFKGSAVEIIEITKLAGKDGDKTVAVDSFEHNNLVLVDEGHRGSSGDVWGSYRRCLAHEGFTFEYSATLGQAAANNRELATEYAKSIIFDYSYRHFYSDGYGKDYRILNLPKDDDNDTLELYLTACLLVFYQQKLLFEDKVSRAPEFNIENPLCVFIGSKVNAVRKQNSEQVSDVINILLFLAKFTSSANKATMIERIETLRSGNTTLRGESGQDVFANMFPFIVDHNITAKHIYSDILHKVFNASTNASLHVEELRGVDGEIALRLGNNKIFGVINVGDASKLCKLCEEREELVVSSRSFTGSLFHTINHDESTIHMLIGSKRFTEGWNSWRVSTMGLMNVGRSEGSQVIQLFGRGVRLWGLNKKLKRHSALDDHDIVFNEKLSFLETLNIFGVCANYMEQFKQYLKEEGMDFYEEIILPARETLGNKKLKTIKIKKGINFKKNGGKPMLEFRTDLHINKVILDYYPRIQSQVAAGVDVTTSAIARHSAILQAEHLSLLDYDALFLDLQHLKKERGWFNLCIAKNEIEKILCDTSWYEVLIPEEQLHLDNYDRVYLWQDIASSLVQKYCDQFYKACKSKWEASHREYKYLTTNDTNFITRQEIFVYKSHTSLINHINSIKQQIRRKNQSSDINFEHNTAIFFDKHLYQPLIYAGSADIKVKPTALNKGENKFISDLRSNLSLVSGKELYILRNMSRGHGIGFFEAGNFYPDFIMWIVGDGKQSINFIDPKGLMNISPSDPKLDFHNRIKTVEMEMGDKKVTLNSFIISVTPYDVVRDRFNNMTKADFQAKNVLFQQDANYIADLLTKAIYSTKTTVRPPPVRPPGKKGKT